MLKIFILTHLFFISLIAGHNLPTIIIESSKMDFDQLDLTQSVDVMDDSLLQITKPSSLQHLSSILPNTNISGIGSRSDTSITLRGISNYVTTESSTAVYIDDVPIPISYGFGGIDFHHLNSIEVYKGPQGTEFGKNAESGVINVYTKPVSASLQSEISAEFGNYGSQQVYGYITGPTPIKNVNLAVSLSKESRDGYSENSRTDTDFDRRELKGISTKVQYKPNTHFDATVGFSKTMANDGGSPFKIDTVSDPYTIDNEPVNDSLLMDTSLLSLVLNYMTNSGTLTSITAHADQLMQKKDYVSILGGMQLDFDVHVREVSQELRWKGISKTFEYMVGGFYSDKYRFDYDEKQTFSGIYNFLNNTNYLDNLDTNKALFAETRYKIGEGWSILAGMRYQTTQRNFSRNYSSFTSPIASQTTWEHWLPSASIAYNDGKSNTYVTYTSGYRPGGYNYRSSGTTLVPYLPETTQALELGHKRQITPLLNLATACFYNRITDLRTITFDQYLATTTYNAHKAHTYGIESTLSYDTDLLDLYGTFGMVRAKYDQLVVNGIDYAGKNLLDAPDMTLSMSGKYLFAPQWYLSSTVAYMGKRYYDISNAAKQSGYTTVQSTIGVQYENWNFELYAKNLFNSEHVNFMIHTPTHDYYHIGAPRTIGCVLTYRMQ